MTKNRQEIAAEYYDNIAEEYESKWVSPFWNFCRDLTWKNLQQYLPKNNSAKILDAGGGTGGWARKVAKLGYNVLCADIAEKMLAVGKKLAADEELIEKIEFKRIDITDMKELGAETFDMVFSVGDPISYCKDPKRAICELARVAKSDSHIVISVDGLYPRLNAMLAQNRLKDIDKLIETRLSIGPGHEQYNFTPDELNKMFFEAGLEVVDIIGKPVLLTGLKIQQADSLLADKSIYQKALDLEMKYNREPSLIGSSIHIQITGRKI